MVEFTDCVIRKLLVTEEGEGLEDKVVRGKKVVVKEKDQACDLFGVFGFSAGQILSNFPSIFCFCKYLAQGACVLKVEI